MGEYVRKTLLSTATNTKNNGYKLNDVIKSIEHVTVHYHDTLFINVDVTLRLQKQQRNDDMTIERVHRIANTVRNLLENDNNIIHKANIYLDLNDNDEYYDDDFYVSKEELQYAP